MLNFDFSPGWAPELNHVCVEPGTLPKNVANIDGNAIATKGTKTISPESTKASDMYWDTPSASDCAEYGARYYTARLWNIHSLDKILVPSGMDWDTACQQTPLTASDLNITNKLPDTCEDEGILDGEYGTWIVPTAEDDASCRPTWGDIGYAGCVSGANNLLVNAYACQNDGGLHGIYGWWKVPYYEGCTCWGAMQVRIVLNYRRPNQSLTPDQDMGCSNTVGLRTCDGGYLRRSAQLLDQQPMYFTRGGSRHLFLTALIMRRWQQQYVKSIYLLNPSIMDHLAAGTFDVPDSDCGVPACPDNMAWDYKYMICMDCSWDGQTPPNITPDQQRRDNYPDNTPGPANDTLKKRVGCSPFNLGNRVTLLLPNNIQAWIDGNGAGPTAERLAANADVRAAFQLAWAQTYPDPAPNRWRERGGYGVACNLPPCVCLTLIRIDGFMRILKNMFVIHSTTPSTSNSINIEHPENESTPVPAGDPSIPSWPDNRNEWRRGVPGIIIHDRGLTAYGPRSRAQMNVTTPQFPMANLDADNIAAHDFDRGRQIG
ncbi:hypothetical protein H0H92_012422, partial [Tricholoma furcatifolium]